jgi:phosphatidylserine decarboxylase
MDLAEAAEPVRSYPSVSALFTRGLRPGTREWPVDPAVAGSPVDGVVGRSGAVREGTALQAKGRRYSVAELLDDAELAARFDGGAYLTIYLSPRHYHRIHAPLAGRIGRARPIPGRLLPVNRPAVTSIDRLFPRNERLVALLEETSLGAVAVVAVGAFNVGRITAAFDDDLATNRPRARAETRLYHPPIPIDRGQEIMTFHLGSTVVLLFERGTALDPRDPGTEIRLGQRVAGSR